MSELSFKMKTTLELTTEEAQAIVDMFNVVMERDRTLDVFYNQFINTPLGYSFHLLMYEDGIFVGTHTNVPSYFIVNGERLLFTTGADTMIKKGHRDIFSYIEMLKYNTEEMKKLGVAASYGFPNDLNYKILMKGKLAKSIGHMYTYCLPIRIGGVKKKLSFLNFVSFLFCYIWVYISYLFASRKEAKFKISKDLESYNKGRYSRNDGKYCVTNDFAYKIIDYEGVRSAFLIDVFRKSPKEFCKAVLYILKHEKDKFDILIYPGHLPFRISGMIKIPHRFEPKHFHVTGGIYCKNAIDKDIMFDINNWDVNLSNYDLI